MHMLNSTQYRVGKKFTTTILFLISLFFINTAMAWEPGYDILTVGKVVNRKDVLFAYDRDTGRAYKYKLTKRGIRKLQSDKVFKWRKTWTHMSFPVGHPLRMFHSGTTGDVQLYKMKTQLVGKDRKTKTIKTYSKFYKGFDIVEEINAPHKPMFLFYDKDKGYAKIYVHDPMENTLGAPIYKSRDWHKGWDIIKPFRRGDQQFEGHHKHYLMYDREEGLVRIYRVNRTPGKKTYESSEWRHTWHSIVPYYKTTSTNNVFQGEGTTFALFYDKTNGVGKVFAFNTKEGTVRMIKKYTGWRKSWDIITTYQYLNETYIIFYDKHSGDVNVYEINDDDGTLGKRVQSK